MKMGSPEYKNLIRKLHELEAIAIPTLAQEVEMAHIKTRLWSVELNGPGLSKLTDDYAQVKAMGDLGGTEL